MEKHIFKFGDSSLALIIPKKWATKHGLSSQSAISVDEGSRGELVLSAGAPAVSEAERFVSRSLSPVLAGRWVGLHYMYGTSRLRLYSKDGFTAAQVDAIEGKINSDCSGFEITSQSGTEITIEDFTNIKEIDLGKVIGRLRFLVEQEFMEVEGGNAASIRKLEQRVNRFYMLGVRYVNIIQPRDYTRYIGMLAMLEQISDNMEMLSANLDRVPGVIYRALHEEFSMCKAGFDGDSKSIESAAALRVDVRRRIAKARLDGLQAHLLTSIADNISNIAEYGLKAEKERGDAIAIEGSDVGT